VSVDDPELVERPDSDDYDLLTYGEVAARMSELLASETTTLAALRAAPNPDAAAIELLEGRIAQLTASKLRYEHQSETAATFMQRFGLPPRPRP
jgi:hypothetical protein